MDREPKEPQLDNPQLDEECNFKAMTDEEIAKSVDLDISDFCDDGADIDELRDIIEGGL